MMKVAEFQNTHFETNCQNFDSGAQLNEALFSGKSLKLLIMEKKDLQCYIVCLCLESFAQNHIFQDN